jgi:cysteine desulfurase
VLRAAAHVQVAQMQGSHVIRAINQDPNQVTVRFSFSRHNTKAEIDSVVEKLKELI